MKRFADRSWYEVDDIVKTENGKQRSANLDNTVSLGDLQSYVENMVEQKKRNEPLPSSSVKGIRENRREAIDHERSSDDGKPKTSPKDRPKKKSKPKKSEEDKPTSPYSLNSVPDMSSRFKSNPEEHEDGEEH